MGTLENFIDLILVLEWLKFDSPEVLILQQGWRKTTSLRKTYLHSETVAL